MICCKDHEIANEMGMMVNLPREAIEDGVVRNNIITEFFLTNKDDEYQNKTYMGTAGYYRRCLKTHFVKHCVTSSLPTCAHMASLGHLSP